MEKIKDFRVKCDCSAHELHLTYDEDFIELSIWNDGWQKYGLSHKLRHIWQIIWRGHPWTDQILLTKENSLRLSEELIVASKQLKDNESVMELRN
jgi:hypothetical protein